MNNTHSNDDSNSVKAPLSVTPRDAPALGPKYNKNKHMYIYIYIYIYI